MRWSTYTTLGGIVIYLTATTLLHAGPADSTASVKDQPTVTKQSSETTNTEVQIYQRSSQGEQDTPQSQNVNHAAVLSNSQTAYSNKSVYQSNNNYADQNFSQSLTPEELQQFVDILLKFPDEERQRFFQYIETMTAKQRQEFRYVLGLDRKNCSNSKGHVKCERRPTGIGQSPSVSQKFQDTPHDPLQTNFQSRGNSQTQQFINKLSRSLGTTNNTFYAAATRTTRTASPTTMSTSEAVSLANQYLTPDQRIEIMEKALANSSGSAQYRLAAYLTLIDAYQATNRLADAQKLVQRMIAEKAQLTLAE